MRRLVLVAIVLVALPLVAFFITLAVREAAVSGPVACYPTGSNGWSFDCIVTGKGEATAHEQFSPEFIDIAHRQGNDLTRTFRGTRWKATVMIENPGRGSIVSAGQEYVFYGTVERIDGNKIRFTDSVFVPLPPKP